MRPQTRVVETGGFGSSDVCVCAAILFAGIAVCTLLLALLDHALNRADPPL